MSTVVDAFKYQQSLRAKGIPDEQATAFSQALADAVSADALAAKDDLRIAIAEATTKLILWMVGTQFTLLALATAIILKFAGHA
jgi:hypothetical protein